MGVTAHTQIRTRTGYARVTLNQGHLLMTYYSKQKLLMDYVVLKLQFEEEIYQDGWNIRNLEKMVRTCEPLNKANDNYKTRIFYHE
jgi:hypothetical protein